MNNGPVAEYEPTLQTKLEPDLKARIKVFDALTAQFECQRPCPLIAVYQIPDVDWEHLRHAAAVYMSRCLPGNPLIQDEEELLGEFHARQEEILNVTPNGMIVPKRHTVLEYNALARAFARIIDGLGIGGQITSWHIPLNLRVKFNKVNEANMKRHHPTEHIHSDSWAGESADSVTTMIPIFGDIARNHVTYYDPPEHFEEEWLGPLPSYAHGAEIASRYERLEFVPEKGQLILADFATLHASHREPNAGHRVSIDTTFVPIRDNRGEQFEVIHPWRENERAPHEVLRNLGETHLFYFPDRVDEQVDSQGGFKHPSHLLVKELA